MGISLSQLNEGYVNGISISQLNEGYVNGDQYISTE